MLYRISEKAKLNNLRPYFYFKNLLTELPKHCDDKGNIDLAEMDFVLVRETSRRMQEITSLKDGVVLTVSA